MKIGLCCPISWEPLLRFLPAGIQLPRPLGFSFGAELAAALVARGHEVHIFTLTHHLQGEQHIAGRGLHVHIAGYRKGGWRFTLDMYRIECAWLRRMIAKYPCDIVHAHWTYDFALPVVTSPVLSVVSLRDNPWKVLWMYRPKSYRLMHLVLAYRVFWHIKHLLVASEYMAAYARRWHFYRRDVALIPNAVADYCYGATTRQQRHDQKVVFACIGHGFKGCKNVDTLLKAFGGLRRMIAVPCELRLYGHLHEPGNVTQQWAILHHLDAGVVFCGELPHRVMIEDVRKHVDVLVHSSREESFGNVIAEAMAIGIPTVVGKSSGAAPWVAGNGTAGLLVDVNRVESIMQAMLQLAHDAALRQSLGKRAHALAVERYRLDKVVDQHIQLYERIMASAPTEKAAVC